jgi:hypothetical protein
MRENEIMAARQRTAYLGGMRFDGRRFVVGVNLPWLSYGGDFGASAWSPEGGVARPSRREQLETTLERLASHGLTTVRWFLLCDGRAGVELDARGRPQGLDQAVRRDMDAALAALERHGVRALFVLFDFMLLHRPRVHRGVTMGGRRWWVADADARGRLVDRVVSPLVRHVSGTCAVAGWDLMNEPEWVTRGEGAWRPSRSVSRVTMRGFLAQLSGAVREAGPWPVTVGLASRRGLGLVRDLGLDLYQVHWYDHVDDPSALVTPSASYGLDAPLLLGEFPSVNSSQRPASVLSAVAHAGYAGALAWSYCADDAFSSRTACEADVARWAPPT